MKNKTVILILSVLAVALYTTAVINFCLGNVLGGIGDVLMASFGALIAYTLHRVGQLGRLADATRKAVTALLEQLTKGVPATLTLKDGKGTITLGHDDDGDTDPDKYNGATVATEDMLTADRIKWALGASIGRKFSNQFALNKQAQKVDYSATQETADPEPETPSGGGGNNGGNNNPPSGELEG